jgi:hypothetical protein
MSVGNIPLSSPTVTQVHSARHNPWVDVLDRVRHIVERGCHVGNWHRSLDSFGDDLANGRLQRSAECKPSTERWHPPTEALELHSQRRMLGKIG